MFCATLGRINWVVAGQKHLPRSLEVSAVMLVFVALIMTALPFVIETRRTKQKGVRALTIVAGALMRARNLVA